MISIFVPALNEEKFIKKTILDINQAAKSAGNIPVDIIIINDGSTDGTEDVVDQLANEFLFIQARNYKDNRGCGVRLKEAIKLAKFERFIIVSGDNDLPQSTLEAIFKNRENADIVMVYFVNREYRTLLRNSISIIFNGIYMLAFNVFVMYLNGPALYHTAQLRKLNIFSKDNDIAAELNIKILRSGSSYCEIASYMKTGLEGSVPLSITRLFSVIKTFIFLFYDIKFKNREKYNKTPVRVPDNSFSQAKISN